MCVCVCRYRYRYRCITESLCCTPGTNTHCKSTILQFKKIHILIKKETCQLIVCFFSPLLWMNEKAGLNLRNQGHRAKPRLVQHTPSPLDSQMDGAYFKLLYIFSSKEII